MQIVIAWTEEEQIVVKYGRVDLGESHKFTTIQKPVACMWLNNGKDSDLVKARTYAEKEGRKVFTYSGERNPLERAKNDVAKA